MVESDESFFAVAPENKGAALAHLTERGLVPIKVDDCGDGLCTLAFAQIPEERMYARARALPIHLGAQLGVVIGDNLPPTIH